MRSTAVRAALTLIVLLAFILPLAACGGSKSVDSKTVLVQASTNMKKIQGFHFVYEVHKPSNAQPGSGLEIGRITGDVNSKGEMQATIDVTQGSIPLSLKFVSLGETQYIQNPLNQKWESVAVKDSPVGSLNLNAGTIRVLDELTGTSYVGEEKKGGVKTHHISGMAAAADVAAIAGAVGTTSPFPTDVWIGVSDGLVYEVDIHGPATTTEDASIWRSIVLSNLNTFVDIKSPQ
jgi:hypothetical protein